MKSPVSPTNAKVIVAAAMLANAASGDILYQNSTGDLNSRLNPGLTEIGDEVILSGGANNAATLFLINQFTISYYGLNFSGDETMRVRFYANNGLQYDVGVKAPGSLLWDSGEFSIGQTSRSTLRFDTDFGDGVAVPKDFTFSVAFKGISAGEEAGVDLYGPPTVGTSYTDYWRRTGNDWILAAADNGGNVDFGARIEGSALGTGIIPEPTTLFLFGGLLLSAPAIWRKMRKSAG